MYSRTTDDYEKMVLSGIRTVIEPSFWLGQERTSSDTLKDYWEYIILFEKNRAAEFGIDHYCAISVNPKEANNKEFADKSLLFIKDYLQRESVVALGEIGFYLISKQEEKIFRKQLLIADELKIPIIIHIRLSNVFLYPKADIGRYLGCPKSGHRMAINGMQFSWLRSGGMISLILGVIWEMSGNRLPRSPISIIAFEIQYRHGLYARPNTENRPNDV